MTDSIHYLKGHYKEKHHSYPLGHYSHTKLIDMANQYGTPTFVIDKDKITAQYESLKNALPNVSLHYAIKALSEKKVIEHLYHLGCNFDVATNGEIEILQALKISSNRTIHTHPIKKAIEIKQAIDYGCRIFVIDNRDEIDKFSAYKDKVELLIRINYSNHDAVVDLSRKFGCELTHVPDLVTYAHKRKIKIAGLSFHVGSQVPSPIAHVNAIHKCNELFKHISSVDWRILDIGGGFPIEYDSIGLQISDFCAPIKHALDEVDTAIEKLAEPGRYLVGPSAIQLLSVVGIAERSGKIWYYLDDGVYGVLSGQIYDHARYPIFPLVENNLKDTLYPSVLAGPTCDSIDVINEDIMLPKLKIGDKFVATQVGAYTIASATRFNLYRKAKIMWMN